MESESQPSRKRFWKENPVLSEFPAGIHLALPVHIAGEIPEFDELAWIDARERKHVSGGGPSGDCGVC